MSLNWNNNSNSKWKGPTLCLWGHVVVRVTCLTSLPDSESNARSADR